MAFVTRSERRMNGKTTQTDEFIGPGAYIGHQRYIKPPAYAPFHSTTTREDDTQLSASGQGPPPGHYNPKFPSGNYDSGLPKKYVPFKSTEQRFGPEKIDFTKENPGPGTYKLRGIGDLDERQQHRTMGIIHEEKARSLRALSAPSIPAREQSYGYERGVQGKLIRNTGPTEYVSGRPNDCIGPNHYNIDEGFTKKRVTGGHIPITPRGGGDKHNATPGPGHYLEKRMSKPKRPGAAFVSKVSRISGKVDADVMPGPGQYELSNERRAEVQANHQFFGSTVERFTDKRKPPGNPGPGSYAAVSDIGKNGVNFKTSTERWRKSKKNLDDPGPGQYEVSEGFGIDAEKIMNCTKSFSVLGNQGALAFGAMSTRFVKSAGQERAPGPGAYRSEQMRMSQTQPSSMFRSKVPKDNTEAQIRMLVGAPLGAYDPRPVQDTAEVVRIPQKKEGFLTAASRFGLREDSMDVGPGQYNPATVNKQGVFNRNIGAYRGGDSLPIGFATCSNRFNEGRSPKKKSNHPGPGDYNVEPEWVKKSYNCLFGEVL